MADPTKYATATVTVTPNSTVTPVVSLSPTSLTFPNQLVGTTSAVQFVTLANTGNATLNFSSNFTVSGDFSFAGLGTCGPPVAAGARCTISVKFTPTAVGPRTGTVTISDNAAGSPQRISLSGIGLTSVTVSISPTSATLVSSGTQQFSATVTGTTNTALTWSTTAGNVSSSGLYAAPAATANTTAIVTATSMADPTKYATATVTVTPNSTVTPVVSLSPTSLTFPNQLVGTTSAVQFVTLANTGNATLNFSSNFTVSGDFSFAGLGTCGPPVAAGASCTISVKFTPTAVGPRTGTVTISDNAAGSPQRISLSGIGLTSVTVSISPTSATLVSGGTQQFSATVTGTTNTALTWSTTAGNVSSSGLYAAPAATANTTAIVTATSMADPTKYATA